VLRSPPTRSFQLSRDLPLPSVTARFPRCPPKLAFEPIHWTPGPGQAFFLNPCTREFAHSHLPFYNQPAKAALIPFSRRRHTALLFFGTPIRWHFHQLWCGCAQRWVPLLSPPSESFVIPSMILDGRCSPSHLRPCSLACQLLSPAVLLAPWYSVGTCRYSVAFAWFPWVPLPRTYRFLIVGTRVSRNESPFNRKIFRDP
jgi:hypothetical protein